MQILYFFLLSIMMSANNDVDVRTFPDVQVQSLDGKKVNLSEYIGQGKPVVISFWATWCAPCKRELDAIAEVYPDWKEEYDIELLAISTDNARGLRKVPAMVSAKGWEFTVLADPEQELMQALNFMAIPQTYLVDGEGNIVYDHTGYNPGDELELEEKIMALH